jgi:tetratricopeptide (TPR) repeat protein
VTNFYELFHSSNYYELLNQARSQNTEESKYWELTALYILGEYEEGLKIAYEYESSFRNAYWIGKYLLRLGALHWGIGDIEQAIKYHEESIEMLQDLNAPADLTIAYSNLAYCYIHNLDYKKALSHYEKGLEISQNLTESRELSFLLRGMAEMYLLNGKYNESLKYIFKALEIRENLKNFGDLGNTYTYLGNIYSRIGYIYKSVEYYNKSLNLIKTYKNKQDLSNTFKRIGDIYKISGKYEKSLSFYEKGIFLSQKYANPMEIAEIAVKQLIISLKLQDNETANERYNLIKKIFYNNNHKFLEIMVKLAEALFDKSNAIQNDLFTNFDELLLKFQNLLEIVNYDQELKFHCYIYFFEVLWEKYRRTKAASDLKQFEFHINNLYQQVKDSESIQMLIQILLLKVIISLQIGKRTESIELFQEVNEIAKSNGFEDIIRNLSLEKLLEIQIGDILELGKYNQDWIKFLEESKLDYFLKLELD